MKREKEAAAEQEEMRPVPGAAGGDTASKKGKLPERIQIPAAVEEIIRRLNARGYEAFAVGGCVRDTLLGREPGDWDVTTSASPQQVKAVFKRTVDTGIVHGTVTVMKDHVGYEVTTYRIDGEYEDGRHPKSVQFTSDLREDLRRRDLTINAMAYSHETGIVDAFGGLEDLRAGLIRCVGDPMDRFGEDALRILRAIRFSAQLGFQIEQETWEAIGKIAPAIAKVSKERICTELTKLLLSARPEQIGQVYEAGISPYISQRFCQVDVGRLKAGGQDRGWPEIFSQLPARKHLRWAAFLLREEEAAAVEILKDLKLDNDTIFRVRTLVRWSDRPIPARKADIRRAMSQMGTELFADLLLLRAGEPGVEELKGSAGEILEAGDCISLKTLAVTGKDLLEAGMAPGKALGEELARLFDLVLEDPGENRKEILLGRLSFRKGLTERLDESQKPGGCAAESLSEDR